MQPIKIYNQPEIEVTIDETEVVVEVLESGTPIELTVGGTFVAWGDIVGAIQDQTDLQTALDSKVDENSPITGATKTKITYDSKGLVNSGTDAEVSDITGLQTALDNKVPYTGAIQNVNLGSNSIIMNNGVTDTEMSPSYFGVENSSGSIYGLLEFDKITLNDSGNTMTVNASGLVFPDASIQTKAAVPYTGATGNVDLGEHGLSAGFFQFDITPTTYTPATGNLGWNDSEGTIDLLLKGGIVSLPIGQKQVARVVNGTGGNVLKSNYQVVKVIGAQGQRLQVGLAQANNDANSADTLGLIAENINNNNSGFIITSGLVESLNTTGSLQSEIWADGNPLYLSPSVSGKITNVKPQAPQHTVIIGFVVYAHQNNGKIFVKVDNGYELDELHNVKINSPTNGQVLKYNSTTSVWENTSTTSGTVTQVNATAGTGISVSGSPITTSGTLTITNTAPDQTVSLTSGTAISTSGTYPNFTITNSAPDQVVSISSGTGISVSGTYPSFTITNTGGSGGSYTVVTKTSLYTETATSGEVIILCDTTSGGFTVNLPSAVSNTAKITIKKIAGSNNLTIDGNGSQTIDGGLTATLVRIYESVTLVSDNANWHII